MMSVRILFSKFPKNIIEKAVCHACLVQNNSRKFSRKLNKEEKAYKPVKPRKTVQEDVSSLVWRDPNFELLASNEFPLFLRGHIGLAWYDDQTSLRTRHDLVMEQVDDLEDASMICQVQTCPTVLRLAVKDLFPYRTTDETSVLSVITVVLKPNNILMRNNKELETEKLAQTFLIAAKSICMKLRSSGYWADFINPFSGRPYFRPLAMGQLYETDEKFRCLDFQIYEIENCKVISNNDSSQKKFIGSLFTNAPSQKNHLNSIFTAV